VRHMEKTSYQELVCLNGMRGFLKEQRMWKMITWPLGNNENWRKCGKGEESCEKRSLFRHQNDSGGIEHGQRNGETDFTTNLNTKIVCAEMVPKITPVFSWKTNTNALTCSVLTRSCTVWPFSNTEKLTQRNPFSVNWRHP